MMLFADFSRIKSIWLKASEDGEWFEYVWEGHWSLCQSYHKGGERVYRDWTPPLSDSAVEEGVRRAIDAGMYIAQIQTRGKGGVTL